VRHTSRTARAFRGVARDHAKKLAEKDRFPGGGDCNFTTSTAARRISLPTIRIFALGAGAPIHRGILSRCRKNTASAITKKTLGQLFCDNEADVIIAMLRRNVMRGA